MSAHSGLGVGADSGLQRLQVSADTMSWFMINFKPGTRALRASRKESGLTPAPTGILGYPQKSYNTRVSRTKVGRDKVKWDGGRGVGGVTSTRHSYRLPAPLRMSRVDFR